MGTVYLANTLPSAALYQVNYGEMFSGRACSDGTGGLPFGTPRWATAQRLRSKVAGTFGYGENTLTVTFPDLVPPDGGHTYTLPFDSTVVGEGVHDPVVVYVFLDRIAALDSAGNPLLATREMPG